MKSRPVSHLSDQDLARGLAAKAACESTATADLLAYIAEFDARQLFRPAGYDSMYAYLVHDLCMSDDSALKRIRAARAARRFPAIIALLAEGRLHISGVAMLAKHFTPENAEELLEASELKTCAQIAQLIAGRFPRPDLPTRLEALPGPGVSSCQTQLAARPVDVTKHGHGSRPAPHGAPDQVALGPVGAPSPRATVKPLSPGRFALQVTIAESTRDKLEYARALLGHAVPTGRWRSRSAPRCAISCHGRFRREASRRSRGAGAIRRASESSGGARFPSCAPSGSGSSPRRSCPRST